MAQGKPHKLVLVPLAELWQLPSCFKHVCTYAKLILKGYTWADSGQELEVPGAFVGLVEMGKPSF